MSLKPIRFKILSRPSLPLPLCPFGCRAVCADIPHFYARNSVGAEIMEDLAIGEGWLAESSHRSRVIVRFAARRSARALVRAAASWAGSSTAVPKYISSGAWPENARMWHLGGVLLNE